MESDQSELLRLKRAYLALADVSARLAEASSEPELLDAVCRSLVEVGGYRLSWIAYLDGDRVQRVASAGAPEAQAYLDGLQFSLANDPLGRGPLGNALRTGRPSINRDTEHSLGYDAWRARALEYGYRSSIALPLRVGGRVMGGLNVYASVPDGFDDDERELLTRLTEGISFGVETLRTREALALARCELDAQERSRFEILEQSPSAWVAVDRLWRFVYVNPKASELLGRRHGELVGNDVWQIFPHYLGTPIEAALRRVMETRQPETVDQSSRRLRRWIECRFYPIDVGLAGSFSDITVRKALEEELRESEQRFRQLGDAIDDVFWMRDIETGKSLYLSAAFARIWGRSLEGAGDQLDEWLATLHPDDLERVRASLPGQLAGDWAEEYRVVRPDGSIRWVRDRCYLVRSPDGRPRRFAGVARDITEQRRLEDQLRQAQKMEAIGQLVGGIAHDFNNLLMVIQNYATFALDGEARGRLRRDDLLEIAQAGDRAADLTRQLLAFGRQQVLQPKVIDMNYEILAIEGMLRRVLGEHIEIVLVTSSGKAPVFVDPSQLSQIVMNLAVNARDAMPSGGILRMETQVLDVAPGDPQHSVDAGRHVLLTVADTGVGMDARTRARIFEPFFTTKEPGKGTGLGLSTVFGIVKQSAGHITVESELGQGTTFRIYLPRTDRAATAAERAPTKVDTRVGGAETILLVEDAEPLRRLLGEVLRGQGYTVLEAANGVEAERLSHEHPGIALLLTDVVMPKMGGKELTVRLTRRIPALRVLYCSGYDSGAIVRDGVLEAGVHFLQKPIRPSALLEKVRAILDEPGYPGPTASAARSPD